MNAIVTGASSGIGLAVCKQLVKRGDTVIGISRNQAKLCRNTGRLNGPGRVLPRPADVADDQQLQHAMKFDDPFDLVVASAGVCQQARLDEPDATEVWRKTMAANLNGVFHTLRLALPRLRDGGSVVVVSSNLGKNARAAYGAYCASKHAVLGLVKAAALELAPRRIRVNAVCPGWVDTPMSAADIEVSAQRSGTDPTSLRKNIVSSLPLGAPVTADQVADLILFLASPAAAAITGQAMNISNGEFTN